MEGTRNALYRFPWSQTDNPGAWIEVTDRCNLVCRGCYRHKLGGDRPLEEIRADIDQSQKLTNCDSIMIAGGEPLLYPHLVEVIRYVRQRGIKPTLLTNGMGFTPELAATLRRAGLAKIHFHVDSGQSRPGWEGKDERGLNALRQQFADVCAGVRGLQCGFNSTVYRSTLGQIHAIVAWARANIEKVQHYSLIAYRAVPLGNGLEYTVDGRPVDPSSIPNTIIDLAEISISTHEMYDLLRKTFPDLRASAYLNGSSALETDKYLIVVLVGSRHGIYGCLGAKTLELVQLLYHLFLGRYCAYLRSPRAGRKLFLLSLVDPAVRTSFRNYRRAVLRNPLRLFDRIHVQSLHFQQPYEILRGTVNLCEDCPNKMVYEGRLIASCRLDEYRMLGGLLTPARAGVHLGESAVAIGGDER